MTPKFMGASGSNPAAPQSPDPLRLFLIRRTPLGRVQEALQNQRAGKI